MLIAMTLYSLQFVFVKGYEHRNGNTVSTALSFMITSSGIIAIYMLVSCGFKLTLSPVTILLAAGFGILSVIATICQIKAFGMGKSSILTMFNVLGSVFIPFGYGIFSLNEPFTPAKGLALILLSLAFLPDLLYSRKEKAKKSGILFFVLCFVCFLAIGIITVIEKIQGSLPHAGSVREFMFFGSVFIVAIAFISKLLYKSNEPKGKFFDPKSLLFSSGYAVFNGMGNVFSILAAATLPSSFQYPFTSGGIMVLSALFFTLIYREKLRKKDYISMACAVSSVLLMIA
jgi:drug/metabolite transporter (DMT)-like permease